MIALFAATALGTPALGGELVVIVHPERDVRLSLGEVVQIYLKQRRFWNGGERIIPLNRESGSDERQSFERAIFGRDTGRLAVYWNRRYFEGVLPPSTLASDEAVKRFVAEERRAIGYIAPDSADATVKIVLRLRGP